MKPNPSPAAPGCLPPDTYVAAGLHDPLVHSTQDLFWYHVEPHFKPVTEEDLDLVRVPPLQPARPPPRPHADDSDAPPAPPPQQLDLTATRAQAFPLCQRLTAALVDEGRGEAAAAKAIRPGITPEPAWLGATPDAVSEFNGILEERVRSVLVQFGLLNADEEGSHLMSGIRLNCWQLRNIVSVNARARSDLTKSMMGELETQSDRRHKKIRDSQAEIRYLESLMDKGKRLKGRVTKLLNQMHPNRHLAVGERLSTTQPKPGAVAANGTGGEKAISKKRRRKSAAGKSGSHKSNPLKSKTNAAAIKGAAAAAANAASKGNASAAASPAKGVSAANGSAEHSATDA